MAANLDLMVVAEGVEDAHTAHMLVDFGCDVVQGFYFARPTRPREVDRLLAQRLPALKPCTAGGSGASGGLSAVC